MVNNLHVNWYLWVPIPRHTYMHWTDEKPYTQTLRPNAPEYMHTHVNRSRWGKKPLEGIELDFFFSSAFTGKWEFPRASVTWQTLPLSLNDQHVTEIASKQARVWCFYSFPGNAVQMTVDSGWAHGYVVNRQQLLWLIWSCRIWIKTLLSETGCETARYKVRELSCCIFSQQKSCVIKKVASQWNFHRSK